MANNDSIRLLRECDAGAKMAVTSINEVIEKVENSTLRSILSESRNRHEGIGNEIHSLLSSYHVEDKEPNPIAKGMSWVKTNMKMTMNDNDAAAADLITDGCNMGIKSLNEYMNQYKNADNESKKLCKSLIAAEERLCEDLRAYL